MSEDQLEDWMLQSSYNNFLNSASTVESNITQNDSIFQISNQIEILKEVLVQAAFQLECYRCHQRLLKNDQNALIKAQKALQDEVKLLNFEENSEDSTNIKIVEGLIKQKHDLNELCENFEMKIENLDNNDKQLRKFLSELLKKNKENDLDILELNNLVEGMKDKSTNVNSSLSKYDLDKNIYVKNEVKKGGIGSYFFGFFHKSSKTDNREAEKCLSK